MQDKCIQTLIAKKNKTIILGIGIVLLVYDDSIQIQQSHHTWVTTPTKTAPTLATAIGAVALLVQFTGTPIPEECFFGLVKLWFLLNI